MQNYYILYPVLAYAANVQGANVREAGGMGVARLGPVEKIVNNYYHQR